MVRMLYDAGFADRVLQDPAATLAGVDLSAEERAFLRDPDPRAWKIDPDRPRRALTVLLREYPASFALAHRGAGIEPLQAFFETPRFHAVVQDRGSMAGAFGAHLLELAEVGELGDTRVAPLAGLERAMAALRRRTVASPEPDRRHPTEDARWCLSPDKALYRTRAGTADLHEEVHLRLAEHGDLVQAVLDVSLEMPATPLRDGEEALLLELARDHGPRVKDAVGAAEITEGLFALLAFAGRPRALPDLHAELGRLGADEDEAPDIIDGLIEEQTLVSSSGEGG